MPSPNWMMKKPRRLLGGVFHVLTEANRKYYSLRGQEGFDVCEGNWDNLIILDGCRVDLYNDVSEDTNDVDVRVSKGSSSSEFMLNNFAGRGDQLYDTVYVTANATIHNIEDDIFHVVYSLITDEWDEEHETVLPETVVRNALSAFEQHPNKRLIIHFMQPHYPFIGETGEMIEHSGVRQINDEGEPVGELLKPVWWLLKYGEVDQELVWQAYRENLELVLNSVDSLIDKLSGRTVITSDHGNLAGDWIGPVPTRGFGHPSNLYVDELVRVPWHIMKDEGDREVTKEPPIDTTKPDDSVVEDRLRELGYIN